VGASKAIEYVKSLTEGATASAGEIEARLAAKGIRVVTKRDLTLLARAELRAIESAPATLHAFAHNEAMFNAIESERERLRAETPVDGAQAAATVTAAKPADLTPVPW
jgi:hypothetical protein